MTISSIKQKVQPSLVYLQTHVIGMGFYIAEYDLIVTAATLVDESSIAVVKGLNSQRASTRVLFTDKIHNLAFLKKPASIELAGIPLSRSTPPQSGDPVIAMGMVAPDTLITKAGQVFKTDALQGEWHAFEMQRLFDHFYTGGPLLNTEGELVGLNFITTAGNLVYNYSIPLNILTDALEKYKPYHGKKAACCPSCQSIVAFSEPEIPPFHCSICGTIVQLPVKKYNDSSGREPTKLLAALSILGKDYIAMKTETGWRIHETDFSVLLDQHIFRAYLGKIPLNGDAAASLYNYLLQENEHFNNYISGCKLDDVILQSRVSLKEMEVQEIVSELKFSFELAAKYARVLKHKYQGREPRRYNF